MPLRLAGMNLPVFHDLVGLFVEVLELALVVLLFAYFFVYGKLLLQQLLLNLARINLIWVLSLGALSLADQLLVSPRGNQLLYFGLEVDLLRPVVFAVIVHRPGVK